MEITKCKYKIRCEMGVCANRADYTITPARVGIRSSIHICSDCLKRIATEAKKIFAKPKAEKQPKSDVCEGQVTMDEILEQMGGEQ